MTNSQPSNINLKSRKNLRNEASKVLRRLMVCSLLAVVGAMAVFSAPAQADPLTGNVAIVYGGGTMTNDNQLAFEISSSANCMSRPPFLSACPTNVFSAYSSAPLVAVFPFPYPGPNGFSAGQTFNIIGLDVPACASYDDLFDCGPFSPFGPYQSGGAYEGVQANDLGGTLLLSGSATVGRDGYGLLDAVGTFTLTGSLQGYNIVSKTDYNPNEVFDVNVTGQGSITFDPIIGEGSEIWGAGIQFDPPTPEPGTMVLLGTGLATLAGLSLRRKLRVARSA